MSVDRTLTPNFTAVALKMCPYTIPKNGKILFLGEILRVDKKLEYRCTTTNLPLCNDTIIVFFLNTVYNNNNNNGVV